MRSDLLEKTEVTEETQRWLPGWQRLGAQRTPYAELQQQQQIPPSRGPAGRATGAKTGVRGVIFRIENRTIAVCPPRGNPRASGVSGQRRKRFELNRT